MFSCLLWGENKPFLANFSLQQLCRTTQVFGNLTHNILSTIFHIIIHYPEIVFIISLYYFLLSEIMFIPTALQQGTTNTQPADSSTDTHTGFTEASVVNTLLHIKLPTIRPGCSLPSS